MKKIPSILSVFATVFYVTPNALAADYTFIPRAEVGFSQYTLDVKDAPFAATSKLSYKIQTTLPVIRLGLTAATGPFYVDGYYHVTAEGSEDLNFPDLGYYESIDADKEEYALTAGYQVGKGWTLFAGYRNSETEATGNQGTDYSFGADGYYFGGGYSVQVTDTGSLALSAAYASLDADLDTLFAGAFNFSETGDGEGLKLSVVWKGWLTENVGYNVSAEYVEYDFNMESPDGDYDITEIDIQMRIGMSYAF